MMTFFKTQVFADINTITSKTDRNGAGNTEKTDSKFFPFYHQHDSMQCGIACLQMICKYHGKEYSQDTLSRYCFATNEGVSLLGISEAATRLGLHTTCGRVTTEQLHKAPLPCILHWNQNHFVVLYRIKKGKIFYIADPGKGLVTYDDREFKEHWLSTRSNGEEKE